MSIVEVAREAITKAAAKIRAMSDFELVHLAMGGGMPKADVGACRVCGCTDADCSACIAKTGVPCSWVESDLCSACVPKPKTKPNAPRIVAAKPAAGELGRRQAQIVDAIRKNGSMRASEMAKSFGISNGAASGSAHELVKKGVIANDKGVFRLVGTRQPGAKPARRPVRGADEEEGAPDAEEPHTPALVALLALDDDVEFDEEPMKLSLVDPIRPIVSERPSIAPVRASAKTITGVFRLPVLVAGPGTRRDDCALYSDCLGRFAFKSTQREAHCPNGCGAFTEISRADRCGFATRSVSPLAAAIERNT